MRTHIKFTWQRKSTPKVVVHGGLTCYQVFFFERITILIRNSMKAGVIRTSEAHSCSVPTTGISIASLLDLSSLANRGIPSAFLMACLFLVLLLQLHKASAPQRATSACMADALARDPQSRSATYQKKHIFTGWKKFSRPKGVKPYACCVFSRFNLTKCWMQSSERAIKASIAISSNIK